MKFSLGTRRNTVPANRLPVDAARTVAKGAVASAIVWGLAVSTFLTLFVVPVLYWMFQRAARDRRRSAPAA